jgi:undecaprenyl-diphosphatase
MMRGALRRVVQWAGGTEPALLLLLLVVVGGVWGYIALADEVRAGGTQRFDEWALRSLRQADDPARPIGPAWLAEVGRDITALGGVAVLVLMIAAVAGYLWLTRRRSVLVFVLIATVGGLLVSELLKNAFDRPRPVVVPHLSQVMSSSFPSGHSMMSAVVYMTLGTLLTAVVRGRKVKVYFLGVALALTGLVGVSRVYMGVHYPTDVLAGWMMGLAWAALCWWTARRLWLHREASALREAEWRE